MNVKRRQTPARTRLVLLVASALLSAAGPAAAAWPMFQGDARHTGRSTAVGPLLANVQWDFLVLGTPGSPVVAADGTVYLPAGMVGVDAQGFLYAINPDGTQKWRATLAGPPGSTAPAVGADGTVYVHVNGAGQPTAVETLHALDPDDGSSKWDFEFGGGAPVFTSFVQSAPTIGADGTIHVGSQDGEAYALDPDDGGVVWSVSPTFSTISSSPAVATDGTIYVHDHFGLFAYDADGQELWNVPISVQGGTGSPSVAEDGTVYFAHVNNGTLYAVNPDGTTKWAQILGPSPVSTPAVASDGTIYVGINGLHAINPNGSTKWRFSEALFSSASPVVGADGTVYWRESSNLYAVNPDGTQKWQLTIPFPSLPGLDPTPAIGPDGTLYVPVVDQLSPLGQKLLAIRTCPADCDDQNPCTDDVCDPLSGCTHPAADDGTGCDDATVCNGHETCLGGACVSGAALNCADVDPCTADTCDPTAGCQHPDAAADTPCPDGNLCNGAETCQAGACTAGPVLDCDDHNACTIDGCVGSTGCTHQTVPGCTPCDVPSDCADGNPCTTDQCLAGICRHTNLADNTSCSDNDFCNGPETCQGGFCFPGQPPSCNDSNPCTADSCDPILQCRHQNAIDGTSCTDNNACNGTETCLAGACAAGTPLNCNDGNPCTTDGCSAASGCSNVDVPNGSLCADGNACNGTESCQGGACTPGVPLDCTDPNPCTDDSCDPGAGCVNAARPEGASCADATVCNGDETCQTAVCTPGPVRDCDDDDPCTEDSCNAVSGCINTPIPGCTACNSNANCNDGNPCTTDVCSDGSCQNLVRQDGSSCSDNDVCNGVEICQGGACTPGKSLVCNDGNPCTADACDPLEGCGTTPEPDGRACADGDLCNGDETCLSGSCTAGEFLDCNDQNPCTSDTCVTTLGCQHANLTNGTPCLDATRCNGDETCADGVCTDGLPLDCVDQNACTVDSCNAVSGCSHTSQPGCTSCTVDVQCNDSNPCTLDRCAGGVCANVPVTDGASCSDGNSCNGTETCAGGACTAGSAAACDDANACTLDFCDPFAGCQHGAVPNGSSCRDTDVCNGDETCHNGACAAGPALSCADQNPCTEDLCDAVAGCRHPDLADGVPCADATVCDGDETCQGGVCQGGVPLACADQNPCTEDLCDPVQGCVHPDVADGTTCADGTVCNGEEICQGGTCLVGTPLDCADPNPCTADLCDPVAGCVMADLADGDPCSDDTVCNGQETCLDGTCVAGTPLDCDDLDPCTDDRCDLDAGCVNDPLAGAPAVSCAFARGLVGEACADQKVPRTIRRRFARAQKLAARAEKAGARKAARLLAQATRVLKKAAKVAMRHKRLSAACAQDLRDRLLDTRARAARLRTDRIAAL